MQQEVIQGFRLSPQQKRLWLLEGGRATSPARCAVRIEGALDAARLQEAARLVVAGHEILRTNFRRPAGVKLPVQIVSDDARLDWRALAAPADSADSAVREAVVEEHYRAEAARPFDLERDPAARFSLLSLSAREHVLFVALPALCADARTLRNLSRAVAHAYRALSNGAEATGDETVQYAQFSEWQRDLLESDDAPFWRELNLAAARSPSLPLEIHGAPPAQPDTFVFAVAPAARLASLVADACAKHDVAPHVFLQTCWQTLLWRLTGQPEIVISVPGENRVYEEMEEALGLYANWLPVPCRLADDLSFAEALAQVGGALAAAREWQEYYSWERVAADGAVAASAQPFDIAFDFEEQPAPERADALAFTVERSDACAEPFKLRLSCRLRGDALGFEFHYDAAVHAPESVELLAARFVKLVESAAADQSQPVGALDVLPEGERRRLLVEWNDTRETDFDHACFGVRFEAQAAATPDAQAVFCEGRSLTFGALNRRANQLARHLRGRGVTSESRVVLCMERSEEMIVGLLGIWKAGGVYVPVDASQPPARLRLLLADVEAQAVLTQERLREKLPPHAAATVCIDADGELIARESDANLGLSTLPQHLAYIIYTSGSTGVPKGVMIQHASLMNLAHALDQAVHDAPVAPLRVSLNAPLAFDSSVKQLLRLLGGHALYVVPEEVRRDTDELLSYIRQHRIDVLDCTPSQLKLLVEAGMIESPAGAPRRVLVGGEALDETLWSQLAGDEARAFYNVYGPTECTVDATACRLRADARRPVIGRPLANTQIYILDGSLNPVPVGVAGELLIGGDGLARGYLNRAELTAERFIPDPFSNEPGARLYRTGDLARFLADGQIEFVGRVDFQVKIRGSRIELGEIESALGEHPMVRRAVVLAREDVPGDKRLAAYVVARQGTVAAAASELRAFLQERLPDYMIPAAFVLLDALPLNSNGKVNRDALPAPDGVRDETAREYVAPRTPVEELLVSVWQQLLGVERVGANDNFFELGGHSLLATQVVSQLRKAFQIELPLRTLFERPDLAQLAESIEATLKGGRETSASPITRAPRDGAPLPLSFAQQRLWFLYQMDPQSAFYNIPAHLRLTGHLDADALKRALNEIVSRHESLRTNLHMANGQPVQVIAAERPLSLPIFDLTGLPAAERENEARQLVSNEARRPFDLATDALLRAVLVRFGDAEHLLLLTFHHIVSDGWSAGILMRELDLLYRAYAAGETPALAPLEVQYADFALWQRSDAHAASLAPALDYWRQKLGDLPPVLDLPTDFPRPPRQRFGGRTMQIELPRPLAEELRNLSRREGATLFMTLLAGWQALLARYTGQTDIVVGTPIAGRTRAEVEGLIGFFINTLPLRTNFEGDPSVRQLLGRVRETALGAFTNQEVPFELLVEELRPGRDLSRSPLFQVLFILQNAHRERLALGDLAVEALGVNSGTAKFDLTLSLEETEDGELRGWIEYDTDLFAPQTIERLASHYEVLLGAMTGDATRAVSELPLMPEAERLQLLEEFNDTRRAYPADLTLAEMFEQQAALTPTRIALVAGDEELTYAELNTRAERLAQHLRQLGVGAESLVAVCAERSARLVTALLAVLKAGGAYVPLDPNYPAERLAYMLADSAAGVLLTERSLEGRLPVSAAAVVHLDELPYADDATAEAATTNDSAASPTRQAGADNLAYVIYTSGSTGQPKGVAVTHRSLSNFLHSMQRAPGLTAADTLLAVTSLSFDIAALELYLPLISGARLVLASREEAADAARLQQLLTACHATVMQATPATWRMLADAGWRHDGALKLLCGGEALPRDLADRLIEGGAPVWNLYGPTETTIWSTLKQITHTERAITIGRPIDNTHLYVLDAQLRPVALNVAGDLYIGGDGLARGYLNRPELTAERFIPDPYSTEAGGRIYLTGDVARRRAGGELEFLGRSDQQVKVRGYRIELGEVEAAVCGVAGVGQCVAVVREEARGDKRLVAYVVAGEGAQMPAAAELRAAVRGRLPEYMAPSVFVVLEELPLTPNGKVDRKRLPAPERGASAEAGSFVAPRNAVEETLAGYWIEVLGVERVGVNDNFFELGGHSLLAVQVVARVRDTFQVELPLRDLFEMPTVAGLADTLLRQETEPGSFEQLAQIMRQLDQLSDEEVGLLLRQEQLTAEAG